MMTPSEFYNRFESTTGLDVSFKMSAVIDLASHFEIGSMLVVGCGDGLFTKAIAAACHCNEIVGVDTSRKLVQRADSEFPAVVSDVGASLPFRDACFDTIVCSEVIEHLIDPDFLLSEIARTLKPGGLLFLTTPNLASWINRISLLLGFQPHFTEVSLRYNVGKLYRGRAAATAEGAIAGHLRLFVPRSLDMILQIHGFRVIARRGARLGYGGKSILPFPLSLVDRLFAARYSTSAFLIYATRRVT